MFFSLLGCYCISSCLVTLTHFFTVGKIQDSVLLEMSIRWTDVVPSFSTTKCFQPSFFCGVSWVQCTKWYNVQGNCHEGKKNHVELAPGLTSVCSLQAQIWHVYKTQLNISTIECNKLVHVINHVVYLLFYHFLLLHPNPQED